MLKKENRIRLKNDFDRVFKHGQSFYNQKIGVKFLENNSDFSRLGIIVSNKVSKKAVERNRLKRIIRDFFHSKLTGIQPSKDFVIIVLPEIDKDKAELEKLLQLIFKKIKN